MRIAAAGNVHLLVSFNGTAYTEYQSTIATSISDGDTASIRALRAGTGIQFWVDSGSGFVQLGDTVAGVSTTLKNSTQLVQVGATNAGVNTPLCKLTRARVWNT